MTYATTYSGILCNPSSLILNSSNNNRTTDLTAWPKGRQRPSRVSQWPEIPLHYQPATGLRPVCFQRKPPSPSLYPTSRVEIDVERVFFFKGSSSNMYDMHSADCQRDCQASPQRRSCLGPTATRKSSRLQSSISEFTILTQQRQAVGSFAPGLRIVAVFDFVIHINLANSDENGPWTLS